MSEPAAPQGYVPLEIASPLIRSVGQFWRKLDGEQLLIGLRGEPHQANSNGTLHGGLIAMLADLAISAAITHHSELRPPSTINLSLDFAGPAQIGQWLEARTEVYRRTRRMAFASCMIAADGVVVVRASAVFRISPAQA